MRVKYRNMIYEMESCDIGDITYSGIYRYIVLSGFLAHDKKYITIKCRVSESTLDNLLRTGYIDIDRSAKEVKVIIKK